MNVVSAHPWQALADDQIIVRLSVEKFQPATISYARMFGKLSCIYLKARKVIGCDMSKKFGLLRKEYNQAWNCGSLVQTYTSPLVVHTV